ncbi:MAG: hypothetical protein ACLQIQ_10265 [Beijerinckiaceae bacterium]
MPTLLARKEHVPAAPAGRLSWPRQPKAKLGMMAAQSELAESERALREMVRAFALMSPIRSRNRR